MTLAALSPLFIWWPLTLAVAFLIARTAGRVGRQQQGQPWMPPHPMLIPVPSDKPRWSRLVVRAPWPPPVVLSLQAGCNSPPITTSSTMPANWPPPRVA